MATDSGTGSGVLLYQVPKMWEWFQNQAVGEDQKNFEDHDRESINCLKQAVSSNMDFKDAVGEGSKVRNVLLETRRKGILLVGGSIMVRGPEVWDLSLCSKLFGRCYQARLDIVCNICDLFRMWYHYLSP